MTKVVVMLPKKEVPEEILSIFQRDRERGEKAFNVYKMKLKKRAPVSKSRCMRNIIPLLIISLLFASCGPGKWKLGTSHTKLENMKAWKAEKAHQKFASSSSLKLAHNK